MADSEVRQKFQIVKQAELSYEVLLDGEHIEEFSDESSASEYVRWFSAKLDEAYSAGMRAGEIARSERSDKDYAIEHAEYLAKAAEAFLRVSNERAKAAEESEDVEDLMNADELLSDHRRALNSAIYEFRKRANRALPAAPEEKKA